jgi:[acyl-carrier-protein] S-malonyltransferase
MDLKQFKARLSATAFAFRGYNFTNLGRSPELLEHAQYGPVVEGYLHAASEIGSQIVGRDMDLAGRVRRREDTTLATYADAIALIVAMEMAQLEVLRRFFQVDIAGARFCFGFSLGEIGALTACGTLPLNDALRIPLSLSAECVELAEDLTLGVLFCRRKPLSLDEVRRSCVRVTQEGRGMIGISSVLSPNSLLLMGQGDTLDRVKAQIDGVTDDRVFLRKNEHPWPPLHTPIVWQKYIPNRAALLMATMSGGMTAPKPPVFSLVTGKMSYNDYNSRDLLYRWTDHTQLLWDAVYETLAQGIETVIHVGPSPNLIPATFTRLRENVETQIKASLGLRAVSGMVGRPWVKALLPARTALLRAPLVQHVVLEDWLLENTPL